MDNKVADALSRVGEHLDDDAIKELLDQGAIKGLLSHATCFGIPQPEADDPRVTQEHEKVEGEIIIQAPMLAETKRNYQNLADSQWVVTGPYSQLWIGYEEGKKTTGHWTST